MLTILASYAQEESRSVSENCKWRIRKDFMEGKPSVNMRIYGYEYSAGKFTVIPEEAEVVHMIYEDYLSGLGRNAIMKKLRRLGIPTKVGGKWSESTVGSILKNEKYIGDMCLQKGFIADHMTKHWKSNNGELPKYYVENNHEAIIDRMTFEAVQDEMADRAEKVNHPRKYTFSEFTGLITCGRCGAKFRKKINSINTKYTAVTWACATFTYKGNTSVPLSGYGKTFLKKSAPRLWNLRSTTPPYSQRRLLQ